MISHGSVFIVTEVSRASQDLIVHRGHVEQSACGAWDAMQVTPVRMCLATDWRGYRDSKGQNRDHLAG
jgi:hypothetical protein